MKKIFVKDIKEKNKIEDIFLVSKKEQGVAKTGKPYLNLKLMDSTGNIEARVWENAENISKLFDKDDFVVVKGYAIAYQGSIQLNVSSIEKVSQQEIDITKFLPSSKYNPDDMFKELEGMVGNIKDIFIKKVLTLLLSDNETARLLKVAPAAKSIHHSYIGGLLEHILSLAKLAIDVSRHYPKINQDMLLAGAVLHDIGKIYELSYDRTFNYTDEGRLLGHITIGVEMMEKKVSQIQDFPKETALLLKHMLLSHHGYLEFGSPKRPKTPEAFMLYYLDDLDSKMQSISALIENERDTNSKWTSYNKSLERYVFKGFGKSASDNSTENKRYDDE